MKWLKRAQLALLFLLLFFFLLPGPTRASSTNGTIDSTLKYAWSNNTGWINFAASNGNVHVTDAAITGFAWSSNYGWINLAPTNGGVTNNGDGVLGGFAWGSSLGWINFSGVAIDGSGHFHGMATGSIIGTLTFDCTHCAVVTDWIPISIRTPATPPPQPNGSIGGGGGGGGIVSVSVTPALPSTGLPLTGAVTAPTPNPFVENAQPQGSHIENSPPTPTVVAINSPTPQTGQNPFDVQLGTASTQESFNWKTWAFVVLALCLALVCGNEVLLWYRTRA